MKMDKRKLLVIAASLYCGCLLISNVIAGKTFAVGAYSLPCAVIIFPVVYILNDMLTEIYGYRNARLIVLMGFAINLLAVGAYAATIALPSSAFFTAQDSFAAVLGNTPRILIASLLAYLCGSLTNAKIMQEMKDRWYSKLMLRCISSTLVGETIDASIFITISFIGTMPLNALLVMVLLQAGFKTLYEVVVYPVTRAVIIKAKKLPEVTDGKTAETVG